MFTVRNNIVQWFVRLEQLTWTVCICQFCVTVSLGDIDCASFNFTERNDSSLVRVGVGGLWLLFHNMYACLYTFGASWCLCFRNEKASHCFLVPEKTEVFKGKLGCKSDTLPLSRTPHVLLHTLEEA